MDNDRKPVAARIENFEARLSGTLEEKCKSAKIGVCTATEGSG